MTQYRTALGRTFDMGQLAAKNEHVRAVGNQSVNARGDTIDSHGKVVVPVTKKVGEAYQRTVANRAANLIRQKNGQVPADEVSVDEVQIPTEAPIATAPVVEEPTVADELLPHELELEDEDADEIEAIKAQENIVIKPASEAPDFVMPDVTKTTTKKK